MTASRTDTNITANISVTASFAVNSYTLTYTAGAHGSITGTTPQTVNNGSDGTTVTAVADSEYHFTSWSDGVLTASRTDTNVSGDITVTANFAINTYTLTYTAGANGSITAPATTPSTHNSGDVITITAVADSNYHFVNWTGDVSTIASTTDASTTITMNGNYSITANFVITIGPLDHFNIDPIGTQTSGSAFNMNITAKDANNHTIIGFTGTVDLTTNSGTISPVTSDSFVSGALSQLVTLTGYGNGRTITATKTGSTETGASNTFNVSTAATKFVIIKPTDSTVDNQITVTVQAQDDSNNRVNDYQEDVTLNTNNHATGGALINIVNGSGTINISDMVAETVTLSLSDTQGTNLNTSSTQDVIFSPGALHHFTFDNVSNQVAGTAFNVNINAKDQYNNTVTDFSNTVSLTTTAGTITPNISGNFSNGTRTESVTLTQSGDNKTISVTNGSKSGTSNSFNVSSGATNKFILNHPSNMTVGTFVGYTVSRQDALGNDGTSGDDIVYLYSTSTSPNMHFYDAPNGNIITHITIPSGSSSVNFSYFDDQADYLTITASDNSSSVPDSTGIVDATDLLHVNIVPIIATKLVIETSDASMAAGNNITATIKAENNAGDLDTTWNGNVTFTTTGNATGKDISVPIINGQGTIIFTDTKVEPVTLSLTNSDPLLDMSSTTIVNFIPNALDHFVFDNIADQIAGTSFNITMTAKDQYDNTVTDFSDITSLSTTAGSIIPSVSESFLNGTRTESVSVTESGENKTITAQSNEKSGSSNSFNVTPGQTAKFTISHPGNMTAKTRLAYTVTRKDQFNNIVTSGSSTTYLSSNSTGNKKFYDAAANGNQITSVVFSDGQSEKNFWYFDDLAGNWVVTVSDNSSSPDGAIGIADDADNVTISSAPIIATKFSIEISTESALVNTPVNVLIKAVDNDNNVDTTFQGKVTLNASGNAKGDGLVSFVNGVGTTDITDATPETISLSLTDSQSTGLNTFATSLITFSSVAASSGTGVASISTPSLSISGASFPNAVMTIFAMSDGILPLKQTIASANGNFSLNFSKALPGSNFYGFYATDNKNRSTPARIFEFKPGVNKILDIPLLSPTISLIKPLVTQGGFLGIEGYAEAQSKIEVEIDGKLTGDTVTAPADGYYKVLANIAGLSADNHSVRVRQIKNNITSDFSLSKSFTITKSILVITDLNGDGIINVNDASIFMSKWLSKDPAVRATLDFNKDGKVDITDFSIMAKSFKQ